MEALERFLDEFTTEECAPEVPWQITYADYYGIETIAWLQQRRRSDHGNAGSQARG